MKKCWWSFIFAGVFLVLLFSFANYHAKNN